MHILNGVWIKEGEQFRDSAGTLYTADWLQKSSADDRAAVGFVEQTEPLPPVDYTPDIYDRNESRDTPPYISYVRKSDAEIAASKTAQVKSQILATSDAALSSGFLHIIMLDLMTRYLQQAQAIVPSVTEADLINPASPYYHKAYAETKAYYDTLTALQDQK